MPGRSSTEGGGFYASAQRRVKSPENFTPPAARRPHPALLRATTAEVRGVYEIGPLLPLSLVVLPELDPNDDDTLPLRLMARGATWRRALATLETRWQAIPLGRALHAAVVQMMTSARVRRAPLTEDEMIDIEAAERFLREERQEERAAIIGAMFPALVQLAELRMGRAMGDDQRAALRRRIDVDGVQAASDALVSLDAVALSAWLREGSA